MDDYVSSSTSVSSFTGDTARPAETFRNGLIVPTSSHLQAFHYRSVFENSREAILIVDADTGVILDANHAVGSLLETKLDQLLGSYVWDNPTLHPLIPDAGQLEHLSREDSAHREVSLTSPSGKLLTVELTVSGFRTGDRHILQLDLHDLSWLSRQKRETERLGRLYAALSGINQALIRLPSRQQLFDEICRVLVEQGGFQMAWIGFYEPAEDGIRPISHYGDSGGYLQGFVIPMDSSAQSQGPTGTAFRTGTPHICNDFLADPATAPWHERAAASGFNASAVFPLTEAGIAAGTLTVYAAEAGFFQDREIELLREAAADVSFGLDNLRRDNATREAWNRLQQERDFSDAVLASLPGVVYLYDEAGRFLRWNRNFELVTGYSSEEVSRMHPADFFPESERELLATRIGEVFEKGESTLESVFLTKSGRLLPYFFTGKHTLVNGQPCLIGVGIDVADRKLAVELLRSSESRYRTLFESAPDGILIADEAGIYLDANQSACAMLGYEREDLIGRPSPDIVGPDEAPHIEEALATINDSRPYYREWQFRRKDGSTFPAEVIATQMSDGRILAMIRDVSERRQEQEELRKLNQSLESEVAARTADLQAALVRAEAADRLKSAFLATMSHELRTPLNSIIGFTGIILQGLAGPLTDEQTKQLGMVRGSAHHLLDLINDVLDISKIEAGQLELRTETFDVAASINQVTSIVQPLAAKKGLELEVSIPPSVSQVQGDRRRIEQVLLNLLSNAIKFTEHGKVWLLCEWVSPADDIPTWRVRIRDSGIGIKPEDLDRLFQPFRQIDSGLSRQSEGTGLGLAISRKLTRMMGGEITVISTPGAGSEFTLHLPVQLNSEPRL